MTLPPDLTLFLAHRKAHKTLTQSQPCKELKMPTHSRPTTADEYLSSFIQHFSNKSLLNTHAHPPPHKLTVDISTYGGKHIWFCPQYDKVKS